ncbi:MAG: hypothetical protein MJE63_22485, partial [Proteobacteria bacterium]|nr:hypothetical protein [Pseudomonadota bacterium]
MKSVSKFTVLFVIFLTVVLMGACSKILPDTPKQDQLMLEALLAIQAEDLETLDRITVPDVKFDEKLCKEFNDYMVGEVIDFEKRSYYVNKSIRGNGQYKSTQWTQQYLVSTDKDEYFINIVTISENNGPLLIAQFNVTQKDEAIDYSRESKRIYDFGKMNGLQYGLFAV